MHDLLIHDEGASLDDPTYVRRTVIDELKLDEHMLKLL